MPQLDEGKARYKECVGARLTAFPDNSRELLDVKKNQVLPVFVHKLRYDAESVFWFLLYWCVLAKPETDPNPEEIPSNIWTPFTDVDETRDDRNANYINKFPEKLCHSTYGPLDGLLADMAAQLRGDLDFSSEDLGLATKLLLADTTGHHAKDSRNKEEYLHEAFQRLIFNFLFKHCDEEFMKEKKGKDYRKVENDRPGTLPLSSHQSESRSSNQLKRKRGNSNPDDSGPDPVSCICQPLASLVR
jgi:hypothetical protein